METYPLTVQNGHLIFEQSQRKFLIDTGSPISFGSDTLHLQGVEHRLHNDPCTLNQINSSSLFNVGIDGLIGTDILHDLIFTVYQKEGKIVFGENPIEFHTTINCHSTLMGVLTCDVSVNHRDYKAVIDTGSSLPYATASVVEGLQPTTNVKDFSPIYGDMSADAYELTVELGHCERTLTVAKATPEVKATIALMDASFLFGFSFVPANVIQLDLKHHVMAY